MRNPFKTRKILIISPKRAIEIEIPFIGKIRYAVKKEGGIRGQLYDSLIADESIKMTEELK